MTAELDPRAATPDGAAGAALRVTGLSVTYANGFAALRDVDLTVQPGRRVGIVGSSGCGKTTLLRAVLGLLPHRATVTGRIELDGADLTGASQRRLREIRGVRLGYVAQDPFAACDPLRRVEHHVAESWTAHRLPPPAGEIERGLAGVGIPDSAVRARQYPHQWSGGMLQRATTVAATARGPVVTLADEPTSALDADLADEALDLLARTCSALVLVSHDLSLVARHTDEILVLADGRVVERGSSAEVLGAPVHPVTRALVEASVIRPRGVGRLTGTDPDDTPVSRVRAVRKEYRVGGTTTTAVADADLAVRAGEVVGILGRSGSGKSTLLRLAAGIEAPDEGQVELDGTAVWPAGSRRATAGARLPRRGFVMPVFQDPVASLDPRWPLWRTVTEPLLLSGSRLTRSQRRARTITELERVGLGGVDVDRVPGSLSVGQCQRVAVVRALIAGPALLVADEPTASLDVDAAAVVAGLLRDAADRGTAVLVVSHDRPRLQSYADRILRMTDGVLSEEDRG
ncbi:ABC transporter ATP-binding protein [Nakamurella leprariae]|uniref:ABC transporter ATP-binding protein n=1 Tax=Nakamurella leprariae TaxID=2803911 RepID=A0A938Y6A7_9ACTN|nr:ATP-binding cassette domain-containing protein [Nakamurella leprariae]MBM9466575.1 ABC transporter ATP-binding protein [Nakamurella leprariae]